jgi:small-conductance mechanosensitive channel
MIDRSSVIVLQQQVPGFLEETIANIVAFLPRLVGAIIILLIGWFVGRLVARIVSRITDVIELDQATMRTPIGDILGGTESAVSRAFGKLAAWYIYFLALLAAANVLAIPELSLWINTAVSYLPAFIAGLLIIVIGFILADFLATAIERAATATRDRTAAMFADGTRIFLYFIAIVVGLETMGVDVGILYIFAGAAAFGLALALAIGVGLAIGLGGREYVDQNIDRWMRSARKTAVEAEADDGGRQRDDSLGGASSSE